MITEKKADEILDGYNVNKYFSEHIYIDNLNELYSAICKDNEKNGQLFLSLLTYLVRELKYTEEQLGLEQYLFRVYYPNKEKPGHQITHYCGMEEMKQLVINASEQLIQSSAPRYNILVYIYEISSREGELKPALAVCYYNNNKVLMPEQFTGSLLIQNDINELIQSLRKLNDKYSLTFKQSRI